MALGNEARLVILFELSDKATEEGKKRLREIKQESQNSNKEIKKAFDGSSESVKQLERSIQQTSRTLAIFGGAIVGGLGVAVNAASKTNYELFKSQNMIKDAMDDVVKSIGVSMVPIMRDLSDWIRKAADAWIDLDPQIRNNIVQMAAWVGGGALLVGTLGGIVIRILKVIEFLGKLSTTLKIPHIASFFGLPGAAAMTIWGAGALLEKRIENDIVNAPKEKKQENFIKIIYDTIEAYFNPASIGIKAGLAAAKALPIKAGMLPFMKPEERDDATVSMQITVGGKTKETEKNLDKLKTKAVSVADEIGNRFAIMADTYMRSLGGIAGVTMTVIQTTIDGVTKGLGDAVAQSIVYGKDFAESMKAALQSLAAQVISFLVSTISKIMVLRALGIVGPIPAAAIFGGGGGFSEAAASSPGGKSIGGFFKSIFPFANGGVISEPVVGVGLHSGSGYTIAERGPEQIVPMGRNPQQMGMGGVNVVINNPSVRSQRDLDEIVYQVSKAFKRETMRAYA